MSTENPFQSPVATTEGLTPVAELEMVPLKLEHSIVKWLIICAISGGPSFFYGAMVGEFRLSASLAMLGGIVTFAILYVLLESTEFVRRKLVDRRLRRALWFGYGTRMVISIVFPLAFVDVFCGIISVQIGEALFGIAVGPSTEVEKANGALVFAQFYFTTLVQGVILNAVLAAYTLIVYAICIATMQKHPGQIPGEPYQPTLASSSLSPSKPDA